MMRRDEGSKGDLQLPRLLKHVDCAVSRCLCSPAAAAAADAALAAAEA
jgi:hypothetical protein